MTTLSVIGGRADSYIVTRKGAFAYLNTGLARTFVIAAEPPNMLGMSKTFIKTMLEHWPRVTTITMIAAVAKNGVIGANGGIPWKLPGDMKHFKETTKHHVLVMGRKTWESFGGKMLPERHHVVVTSNEIKSPTTEPSYYQFRTNSVIQPALLEAVKLAKEYACDIFIIGGGQIYAEAMDYCDKLLITHLDAEFDGDVKFPTIGDDWYASFSAPLEDQRIANTVTSYVRAYR